MSSIKHISKAHDHFFRTMMEDKRVAQEFFMAHLPKDVLDVINLDHLELQSASYIDDMLKEFITDMLFKTTIASEEAFLYLLVDHQSRPDKLMPFRVLKYLVNAIEHHHKNTDGKRIPLILPMVVYHGKQAWRYSNNINDIVDGPKELVEQYFLKPFTLIDLNNIDDAVLKERTWAGIMELTLKHIFKRDMLQYLPDIIKILKQIERANGKNLIQNVLIYILDRGDMNKDKFISLIIYPRRMIFRGFNIPSAGHLALKKCLHMNNYARIF